MGDPSDFAVTRGYTRKKKAALRKAGGRCQRCKVPDRAFILRGAQPSATRRQVYYLNGKLYDATDGAYCGPGGQPLGARSMIIRLQLVTIAPASLPEILCQHCKALALRPQRLARQAATGRHPGRPRKPRNQMELF